MKLYFRIVLGIAVCNFVIGSITELRSQRLAKVTDDATNFFTNMGKIGLTVTNFGTLGTRNGNWPDQPSCEYPIGSRIEHMYQGGLWVGAKPRSGGYPALVSTGVTDRSSSSGEGYEFTTEMGDKMIEISSLSTSSNFNNNAISHQDFIAEYSDLNTRVPATNDSIFNHRPLGIKVHQESYAWNYRFADNFVIVSYTITNVSPDTLDEVYIGLWFDNVVRNTNYVRPGVSGYFTSCLNGYDSLARMMYTFEGNSSPGSKPADSYIGVALLGTDPFPFSATDTVKYLADLYQKTYFNAWLFRGTSVQALFSPTDDYTSQQFTSRYTRMTQSIPQTTMNTVRTQTGNYVTMLSSGPWQILPPGKSVQVVFGIVCAQKYGVEYEGKDLPEQRTNLNIGLQWAQRCYDGEDINGNNSLDPGEDIVSRVPGGLITGADGKLTRYVLPSPPNQPQIRVEADNQKAILYWDKSAEFSRDPISGSYDFEGYRVYRSFARADYLDNQNWLSNIPLAGEFDLNNDTIGYNTGLDAIRIDTSSTFSGITFSGDTTKYFYRFPPRGTSVTHLNGMQYFYGVSAYDQGDIANNLNSLESAIATVTLITGTKPTSDPAKEIGVYPNPYYTKADWDGSGERYRKIYFYNLPGRAVITIYTIAGDVVAKLDHNSNSTGTDIEWFQKYGKNLNQIVPGGEHAWDLISKYDQAIATGLYLFTVEDKDTGNIKRGKFLIIK